jgi:hypothetical protein
MSLGYHQRLFWTGRGGWSAAVYGKKLPEATRINLGRNCNEFIAQQLVKGFAWLELAYGLDILGESHLSH